MSVFILATLDTKGEEAAFLRDQLVRARVPVTLVDTGALGTPAVTADIARREVFAAAGADLTEVAQARDRGQAISLAAAGAARLAREHFTLGELSGVLAIGGSAGTTIGTAAMRSLPLGVPKLMVSTLASGQVRQYVGDKDILMLNSIVDIAGLNRISREVLGNAAAAMAGMVAARQRSESRPPERDRPL
ncbi:MAG: Tm-1-like ATP-binding domain-containing protein, partial [Planctomycetaceae bacterium]|nr:Tm-1-like ATP-binding domain-containing protein [Planctomycetaceae bacterium]